MKKTLLTLVAAIGFASLSQAVVINPVSASGTGSYNNSIGLISDGVIPSEGTAWTASTNVYWTGTAVKLTVDLGALYTVTDILVSVDNNDNYAITYSADNINWLSLTTILSGHGETGWGMDTMSSDSTHPEYVAGIDFSSVNAQYLAIQATGGDNYYSVGEFQIHGYRDTQGVPDSGSTALLTLVGIASLVGLRKRLNK